MNTEQKVSINSVVRVTQHRQSHCHKNVSPVESTVMFVVSSVTEFIVKCFSILLFNYGMAMKIKPRPIPLDQRVEDFFFEVVIRICI